MSKRLYCNMKLLSGCAHARPCWGFVFGVFMSPPCAIILWNHLNKFLTPKLNLMRVHSSGWFLLIYSLLPLRSFSSSKSGKLSLRILTTTNTSGILIFYEQINQKVAYKSKNVALISKVLLVYIMQ